jgi:short-subunit dehydrogenase
VNLDGRVVVLTGASRGIGVSIALAIAKRGGRLVLAARDAARLEAVRDRVQAAGGTAHAVPTDLGDPAAQQRLLAETERLLGPVEVLVNNAGVESVGRYHELDPLHIDQVLGTNLLAPMRLTRLALPGMLERGRGHVVNVASLAGLSVAAFNEAYAASKFGLVGFTRALRASLRHEGAPVSASAVCPGFVEGEGMFAEQRRGFGVRAPRLVGSTTPDRVADAVLRAVERDLPEVIVNPGPMRPILALGLLLPRLSEWLAPRIGANDVFADVTAKSGGGDPR